MGALFGNSALGLLETIGCGSSAATTSIFLFLNKPRKPPWRTSFEFNITASAPNSVLICFIASGIDAAINFFTFMLRSPPQHFELEHLVPIHYMIEDRKSVV